MSEEQQAPKTHNLTIDLNEETKAVTLHVGTLGTNVMTAEGITDFDGNFVPHTEHTAKVYGEILQKFAEQKELKAKEEEKKDLTP